MKSSRLEALLRDTVFATLFRERVNQTKKNKRYMRDEDDSIEDLLEDLRQLRIRETAIIARIQSAAERRGRPTAFAAPNLSSEQERQPSVGGVHFTIGTRVRIKNKVRKPATAGGDWTEERERLATVTETRVDQVHFVTDNGTRTWRAPNNLQRIN